MRDIMKKLSELEATAPKVSKKKMLNEDSATAAPGKRSLKDVFNELHESVPIGAKPLPVLDPTNKQAGMGFVTSTNPSVQNMLKNLDPKDVQIVQAPGQTQGQQPAPTAAGYPAPTGSTGSTSQPRVGQQVQEQDEDEDMDEGFFVCIGDEEDGGFVGMLTKEGGRWREVTISGTPPYKWGTGYMSYLTPDDIMQHIRNDFRHSDVAGPFSDEQDAIEYASRQYGLGQEQLDELSPQTLKNYTRKAYDDKLMHDKVTYGNIDMDKGWVNGQLQTKYPESPMQTYHTRELSKRTRGLSAAARSMNNKVLGHKSKSLATEEQLDELSKEKLGNYIKKNRSSVDKIRDKQMGVLTGDEKAGQYTNVDYDRVKDSPEWKDLERQKMNRDAGRKMASAKMRAPRVPATEEQLDELSPKTLQSYDKKAEPDFYKTNTELKRRYHNGFDPDLLRQSNNRRQGMKLAGNKLMGRAKVPATGVSSRLPTNEGAKVDRMVKHIEKSERDSGKSKDKASDIAWATANKRGMLDNKNKKVKEADIPSTQGIDTMGAGLGAGRSATTLESKSIGAAAKKSEAQRQSLIKKAARELNFKTKPTTAEKLVKKYDLFASDAAAITKMAKELSKVQEGKKPDFLDLDKDGDKKEPMKKAVAGKKKTVSENNKDIPYNDPEMVKHREIQAYLDKQYVDKKKKKKKVDESMNHRVSAARFEGKSHGLKGHAHCGKAYEDLEEMRAYHEGYKEGLDECYGQGVYETAMPATIPGMASAAMPAMEGATEDGMDEGSYESGYQTGVRAWKDGISLENNPYIDEPELWDSPAAEGWEKGWMDAEEGLAEGNAFTAALAKTPKGGKFSVGGKSYTDRSTIDEYAFESWDNQLNALLNEGLSVSISKGQQNTPDSVTITAQDQEAEHLLAFVKNAGLGLFGDDNADTHSSAMSVPSNDAAPGEVGAGSMDIDVVDGHDGMLGLMQKLSGIAPAGSEDYADEEDGESEEYLYGNSEEEEASCDDCGGMKEQDHSCGGKMDEEESEDQMEFEVSEDNPPDTGEAESTADEDAEAKEDANLAEEDDEEDDVNESFYNLLKKFDTLAEAKESDDEDEDEDDDSHKLLGAAGKAKKSFGKEKVDEWANNAGPGKTVSDTTFEQDIDFMTKVISGGLNKPKSTGQTTVPVIAGQDERMHDNPKDWATLAGIKK